MKANSKNIYLSDLLAVPMPKHAASHEDYLRKIKIRRIVWGLLPYVVHGLAIMAFGLFTMFMLTTLALSLGG